MITTCRFRFLFPVAAICLISPAAAHAGRVTEADYFSTVGDMLTELGPRSAHAAVTIRDTYRPYIDYLALENFDGIAAGLATGGLVPLPDPERFNIRVRLDGLNPIGEMDLEHQESYVSARAATIGCLLDIASRVTSGPIEVTSLVRHMGYQESLRALNANATTEVPTHALGLAFDIAMMNTPLPTVLELRDVLQEMSDAGDILFIAERQQLVFHVVPQPSRLGFYSDVYAHAMTGRSWPHHPRGINAFAPAVSATVSSLQPLPRWSVEWWAADNVPVDLPTYVNVVVENVPLVAESAPHGVATYVAFLGDLMSSTWQRLLPWTPG